VLLKRPVRRPDLPVRASENEKRRLDPSPPPQLIQELLTTVKYGGSSKHKRHPHLYGLPPVTGFRGDATLCDEHANFRQADMATIPQLIARGVRAGLVGTALWTVADNGWIYEGRLTNAVQSEYHGYPVRPSEAIAEAIYMRFRDWVDRYGSAADKKAASNCQALYGFS